MKNLLKYITKIRLPILAVVVLLIIQAFCDLALPNYTSDLLNVGLQQGGIEDAVPDTIRSDSLTTLELFLTDENAQTVSDAYSEPDEEGIRTYIGGKEERTNISEILAKPECIVYQLQTGENTEGISLEQIQAAIASSAMTKEQLLDKMSSALEQMDALTGSYLNQIAVYYVSAEYEAQGISLSSIRNAYLLKIGGIMTAMAVVMMAVSILTSLISSIVSGKIGQGLRAKIFDKVMAFSSAEMEKFSTASLITRSTNDIQQVQMAANMLLRMVLYAPILAVGGIIMVVRTGAGMGWVIVLAVVLLAACIGILMGVAMPKFRQMQVMVDRLNLVSREMLTGIMPIRAFSREKHEEERFDQASEDLYRTQLFTNRAMAFLSPVMMLIMNGLSVLIVWVGAHRVDTGTMQVGDLTAFITYSMVIVMGFMILSMVSIILPRAGVAADRINEVLNTSVSILPPEKNRDDELKNAQGILEFHDVTFRYPGASEPAVEHISFRVLPGETTAIIGSTGCGKSTIVNLIPRFYDVTEGSITLDGVDIRELSLPFLRSQLGYVPQKGVLFSGTIASNIGFGGRSITEEDIREAAEIAQAQEFIETKQEGYDSAIAQGGNNVSGGQKQRLSIARAIAKHPKVLLFDDSFSALDYKTDAALRKALAGSTSQAAVLIVAQRISTIAHADNIIVLDDGKIAGQGTHTELLKSCPTYREIAESQLSAAELEQALRGGED